MMGQLKLTRATFWSNRGSRLIGLGMVSRIRIRIRI